MKKILSFFALILIAFVGVIAGCTSDRYANLLISFTIKTEATASGTITPTTKEINGEQKDYVEIYYQEPIQILSAVSGMSDINLAINYSASDPEAISITNSYNTVEGTYATITGVKPTEENTYYVLRIASAETSTKYKELYIKVVLPVDSISLPTGLALTKIHSLDLNKYLSYHVDNAVYGNIKYSTNQKGVTYEILSYEGVDKTNLMDSGFVTIDPNTGLLKVSEFAENYAGTLKVKVTSNYKRVVTEEEISYEATISVFEDIALEDIAYASHQTIFRYPLGEDEFNKTTMSLYSNIDQEYLVDDKGTPDPTDNVYGEYYNETLAVRVATSQAVKISCVVLGEGDANVVYVQEGASGQENNALGNLVAQNQNFIIRTRGVTGNAKLNVVVTYEGTANPITYTFNETKLSVTASGVPTNLIMTQDNQDVATGETLTIYDEYKNSATTSDWGSKFSLRLATGATAGILDSNKKVQLRIKFAADGTFAEGNFKLYGFNNEGSIQTLSPTIVLDEVDGKTVVDSYFLFDLSKVKNDIFYIKAINVSNAEFKFEFKTILENVMQLNDGSVIDTKTLEKTFAYTVETKYGVKEMIAKDANDNIVDSKHRVSDEYKYLTIRKFNGVEATSSDGSLLSVFANLNADISGLKIDIVDDTVVQLIPVGDVAPEFEYDEYDMVQIIAYSIVGLTRGSTEITFTARNGYSITINVKVVEQPSGLSITIDEAYNNQVITKKENNVYGRLETVYAKVNGSFNVYTNLESGASGIISYEYQSSNKVVATVNDLGKITTLAEGKTKISVVATYYKFVLVDGYLQWEKASDMLEEFELNVFIPSTNVTLNNYYITVYDSNSLGYEYQDNSIFEVSVLVSPITATIYGDESKITYSFSGNQNGTISHVPGYSNRFQATFADPNTQRETIYIIVNVEEFGTNIPLLCTVTVLRAVQIQEIKANIEDYADEEETTYFLSMYQGETFNMELVYKPTNAFVTDLVPVFFEYNDGELGAFLTSNDLITLNGRNLTASRTGSGYIYLRIFARDSMYSPSSGKTFITILIQVTDGTVNNPYQIKTVRQLQEIELAPSKHYVLGRDINIGSVLNWRPIKNFSGTLNGYNVNIKGGTYFSITNLSITSVTTENIGLFEEITSYVETVTLEGGETHEIERTRGAVVNLRVTVQTILINQNIISDAEPGSVPSVNVGVIAGVNKGLIMNCAVEIRNLKVNVMNRSVNVGGIVGSNEGVIYNFSNHRGFATVDFVDEGYTTTEHKLDSVMDEFEDYKTIPTRKGSAALLIQESISPNPVKGTITVNDNNRTAYVGGMVGSNTGLINGIYGVFNYIEENRDVDAGGNVNYAITYQSQGTDALVNINHGDISQVGTMTSINSAVGGIAGYSMGKIFNCSTDGYINGFDNIGGIVGMMEKNIDSDPSQVKNTLSSVKIKGNTSVGGVVGYAKDSELELVRVETYQTSLKVTEETLINAVDSVGGIAGFIQNTTIKYAYSASFIDATTQGYETYGDIYIREGSPTSGVGGAIGFVSTGSDVQGVYSTLRISVPGANSTCVVGPLVGKNSGAVSNAYYIGSLNLNLNDKVGLVGSGNSVSAPCYYQAKYDGREIEEGVFTDVDNPTKYPYTGSGVKWIVNSNYDDLFSINYTRYNEIKSESGTTYYCPVLVYQPQAGIYRPFIKIVPSSINVGVNVDNNSYDNNITVDLGGGEEPNPNYQTATMGVLDKYAGYKNPSGQWLMILEYSAQDERENIYNIADVMKASATPDFLNGVNILVTSSDDFTLEVTTDGKFIVKRTGVVTLTFRAKLNYTAVCEVKVNIINTFDKLEIFSDISKSKDLLVDNKTNATAHKVRKDATFYPLPNFVDNGVALQDITTYTLDYEITTVKGVDTDPDTGEYIGLTYNDGTFVSHAVGTFKVVPIVKYVGSYLGEDITFSIRQLNWVFYVSIYEGAENIILGTNEKVEVAGYSVKEINVQIKTDNVSDKIGKITFTDESGVVYTASKDADNNYTFTYKGPAGTDLAEDEEHFVPFEIKVKDGAYKDGLINSTIVIAVEDEYKNTHNIKKFILKVSPLSNENLFAELPVNLIPQEVNSLSAMHYQYNEVVKGNDTSSYSFSANPSNAVIPGNVGLFEIDLFPYYSGIESISISSSIDPNTGSKLTFGQLVRVTSTDVDGKNYFILAPRTTFLPDDSGIYLDQYSYIDSELAKIHIEEKAGGIKNYRIVDPMNPTIDIPRSQLQYKFDDGYTANAVGTGNAKLYVQTIAPSTLQDASSFDCYITIKYYGVNEVSGELELKTRTYTHTLYIETLPQVYLSVKDREANVIAYTNEKTGGSTELGHDSVEFVASVSTGATVDALEISDIKNSNGESKVSINFSDFAVIRNNVLYLNTSETSKVAVGDIIVVTAQVTTEVETFVSVQTASCEIEVVDVVIKDVTVQGLNADNNMFLTVSTSKQLKVSLNAYGTIQAVSGDSAVFGAEQIMSNAVTDAGAILYWQTMYQGNYINIDSTDVSANLPFYIAKNGFDYEGDYNISNVVVTGKTSSGIANLRFYSAYFYKEGKIVFYNPLEHGTPNQLLECGKDFSIIVKVDSNDDNPTPVYSVADLNSMQDGGNYILMSDIEIDSHKPITAKVATFDGNNHVITIKAFSYNPNLQTSTTSESINLGLFDTVSTTTTIKNVIVALPNDKTDEAKLQLTNYTTINIGGIAGQNDGVIYNCDVITVDMFNNADPSTGLIRKNNYQKGNFSYTLNAITSPVVNNTTTESNIGLFVGVNTGNITNSRVGRNEVTVVSTYDSTVASTSLLKNVAPITIMKVEGKANISGFVAKNTGTISTSFSNNIQIQSIRAGKSKDVKTAGFVVENSGYVYGSYAAGWEEANEESDSFLTGTNIYVLNNSLVTTDDFSSTRKLGGGLFSNGSVAGFVYTNTGYVEDCYSDINISGNTLFACNKEEILATPDYDVVGNLFAGGFILENGANAIVKTSYANSKTDVTKTTHGIFVGVDAVSNVQNEGSIDGCYFLVESLEAASLNYSNQPASPLSDASSVDLGGTDPDLPTADANEFIQSTSFASFSFSAYEYNDLAGKNSSGVWAIKKYTTGFGYPELISANNIATSVRVINVAQTNEDMNIYYYNYVEGYEKGSLNNPQIVTTASEFNNLFTDVINASTLINENISAKFTDNIRLVKNIDFTNVVLSSTAVEYTSLVDELSIFDGNYMALTNIVLSDESSGNYAFGLFRTLNKVGFKCLTLSISDITSSNAIAVGGLAGIIVNSDINNINLVASNLDVNVSGVAGRVLGNHFVGGLAGIVVASEAKIPHKIQNINSNLSILAGHAKEGETIMTLKSGVIWNKIVPPSQIEGSSSTNNNLRLQYLPTNYYYAGGIVGAIDIKQASLDGTLDSVSDKNFSGIVVGPVVVSTPITANFGAVPSLQGQYVGGVAGFIGKETLLEDAGFIVNNDNTSNITSYLVAGGIVGQNYGVVSQCYVQYNDITQKDANEDLVDYIGGETNVSWFKKDLFRGTPTYVGGIVGVNIGSSADTGHIKDCYNRVNVINENATAIGGIVGATHIGSISNVYTTGTVIGNLEDSTSSIGAVLGKVLTDSETVFCAVTGNQAAAYRINLQSIVALNCWDTTEFDKLYEYVYDDDHNKIAQIGALYGANTNEDLIYIDVLGSSAIYIQDYIIRDYTSSYILDKSYNISNIEEENKIELFLGSDTSLFHDYLFPAGQLKDECIIDANEYRALLSTTVTEGVSSLRTTYFSQDHWKREVWSYADEYILPLLEYGFISDVVRIYTADDFVRELTKATVSNKLYVIMNDIDFKDYGGVTTKNFQINSFSGMLYGNTISYKDGPDTFTRKPILFNLNYNEHNQALFASAVNGSFANFTIVVNSYDVVSTSATTNKSSVLAARSTNTNINNVNVYNSLGARVNDYAELDRVGAKVTQGKSALYGTVGGPEFLRTFDAPNAKEVLYKRSGSEFVKYSGGLDGAIYDPIAINTLSEIKTNTLFFGGLVADGSSITISSSSFNVGVNIDLTTNVVAGNNSLYLGGIAGNLSGSIINSSVITNKFVIVGKPNEDYVATYIGGIGGSIQGRMTNTKVIASTGSLTISIGTDANKLKSTITGNFIGGIGGNVSSYLTNNNATVGGVETIRTENVALRVFVDGKASVGGIAGSNGYGASDVRYLFTSNAEHIAIKAAVHTELLVGAIFGNNTCTSIKQAYTNARIAITNEEAATGENSTLYVGGLIGKTVGGLTIADAVVDGEKLEIKGRPSTIVGVGSVIGYVNEGSNTAVVTLRNVVTSMDTILDSQTSIAVGGAVGSVPKLMAESLKVLGNITINASTSYDLVYDSVNPAKYFFYIGGLAGRCDYEFSQGRDPYSCVVATTIRNYDVAHQADAKTGAIFGKGPTLIASNGDLVYFNEGTTLAADYGNNAGMFYGNNVPQIIDETAQSVASLVAAPFRLTRFGETYQNHTKTFLYDEFFLTLLNTTYYSKFKQDYLSDWYSDASKFANTEALNNTYGAFSCLDFNVGSKLNPIEINQTDAEIAAVTAKNFNLMSNKYYLLTSDIIVSTTYDTSTVGWVLSCQGYGIYSKAITTPTNSAYYYKIGTKYYYLDTPVFKSITKDSVVAGLITYSNMTTNHSASGTYTGAIARENNGVVFACGVKGQITNNNTTSGQTMSVGGLIGRNLGTITDCFSMAEMYARGNGAYVGGLVGTNGTSAIRGQITNSFFTGSAYVSNESGQSAAGIAAYSEHGFISNSYSIANLMPTTDATLSNDTKYKEYLHPIAFLSNTPTIENIRFFKAYYDQNAYIGSNRGAIVPERPYLSGYGLPINTGKLEGSEIVKSLPGHWISSNENWKNTYKASTKYGGELDDIKLTSSWFNHGYAVKQFKNILVSQENVSKFLDLFYTGNGKAKVEGVDKTNSFVDKPFLVKHAGLLEIFVLNDKSSLAEKSYYIVNNDLYFDYYKGNTYWAESWDKKSIRFDGDFNGAGYTIYNMYSDYGLFRALGSSATIYDFKMENCYSQTGLIAGYVAGGDTTKVEDVTIVGKNYVYNSNLNDISPAGPPLFEIIEENPFSYKNAAAGVDGTIIVITQPVEKISIGEEQKDLKTLGEAAGGLFGFIERGMFTDITFDATADIFVWAKEYAGGVVGYIQGGTITDITLTKTAKYRIYSPGISFDDFLSSGGYAGGIAGYACTNTDLLIQKTTVPATLEINAGYAIGGIVGYMGNRNPISGKNLPNKANIKDVVAEATPVVQSVLKMSNIGVAETATMSYNKHYVGGIAGILESLQGEITVTNSIARTLFDNELVENSLDYIKTENYALYVGGIVGESTESAIVNCSSGGDRTTVASGKGGIAISLTSGTMYVGGVAAKLVKGAIQVDDAAKQEVNYNIISCTADKVYAGGIVGYMQNGTVKGDTGIYLTNKQTVTVIREVGTEQVIEEGHAGGIIGYLKATLASKDTDVIIQYVKNEGGVKSAINSIGGIIGCVESSSSLRELVISDSIVECEQIGDRIDLGVASSTNIAITHYVGGVVGKFKSASREKNTIKNMTIDSEIFGEIAGGIVGSAENLQIQSVKNIGKIYGVYSTNPTKEESVVDPYVAVGGIAGKITGVDIKDAQNDIVTGAGETGVLGQGLYREKSGEDRHCVVYVGGLVGMFTNSSFIGEKASNSASIKSENAIDDFGFAGGIIGYLETSPKLFELDADKYVTNSGSVTTDYFAGGIIGYVAGAGSGLQLKYAINNGSVSGSQEASHSNGAVGGIVGQVAANLTIAEGVTNNGSVSTSYMSGGIVGYLSSGTVTAVINNGTVSGIQNAGGIVGVNNASITTKKGSVINKGKVELLEANSTAKVGGIVGYNMSSKVSGDSTSEKIVNKGLVIAAYTTLVENDIGAIGGVIGYNEANMTTKFLYNEYDSTVTGLSYKLTDGSDRTALSATVMTLFDDNNPLVNERRPFEYVGGIIGYVASKTVLIDCYSLNGTVTGYVGDEFTGTFTSSAIVGANTADVSFSSESATRLVDNVKLNGMYVGGVVGYAYGKVTVDNVSLNPTFETTISATYVGGVIGYVDDVRVSIGTANKVTVGATTTKVMNGTNVGGIVGYSISTSGITIGKDSSDFIAVSQYTITGTKYSGGVIGYAVKADIIGNKSTVNDPLDPRIKLVSAVQELTISVNIAPSIDGEGYAGGIVGYLEAGNISTLKNSGNITNSTSGGNTKQAVAIGGIAGAIGNKDEARSVAITNCQNTGTIGSSTSSVKNTGGMVGYVNNGRIVTLNPTATFCVSNTGAITSNDTSGASTEKTYVGGIVGYLSSGATLGGSTTAVKNSGAVSNSGTKGDAFAGGVVGGMSTGTIGNQSKPVENTVAVTSNYVAGGIVGIAENEIEEGAVSIYGNNGSSSVTSHLVSANSIAGGIVGKVDIKNAATITTVTGSNFAKVKTLLSSTTYTGGIVGYASSSEQTVTIGATSVNETGGLIQLVKSSNEYSAAGGIIGFGRNVVFRSNSDYANKASIGGASDTSVINVGGIVGILTGERSEVGGSNEGAVNTNSSNGNSVAGGIAGLVCGEYMGTTYGTPISLGTSSTNNKGTIGKAQYIGGIVGKVVSTGPIRILGKNTAKIEARDANNSYAGGIVGYYSGSSDAGANIKTYGNTGNVIGHRAGGIIGSITTSQEVNISNGDAGTATNGTIDSTTFGQVSSSRAGAYLGGLIGYASMGNNENNIFTNLVTNWGSVTATGGETNYVGGIVGKFDVGVIARAENKATVTSNSGKSYAGGIAGATLTTAIISQASNEGNVTSSKSGTANRVGGIVGYAQGDITGVAGVVQNAGAVVGSYYAGGIAGYVNGASIGTAQKERIKNTGTVSTTEGSTSVSYAGGIVAYVTGGDSGKVIIGKNETTVSAGAATGGHTSTVSGGIIGCYDGSHIVGGDTVNKIGSTSNGYVGGIIGQAKKEVEIFIASSVNGAIEAKENSGGIVGRAAAKVTIREGISVSLATAAVQAGTSGVATSYAGGVVGYTTAEIEIKSPVSINSSTIKAAGTDTSSTRQAGGVVGHSNKAITISGKISLLSTNIEGFYAGGIIGTSDQSMECTAEIAITGGSIKGKGGSSSTTYAGGLFGYYKTGTFKPSSPISILGNVAIEAKYVGGMVGLLDSSGKLEADYRIEVTAGYQLKGTYLGGIAGYIKSGSIKNFATKGGITIPSTGVQDYGGVVSVAENSTITLCVNGATLGGVVSTNAGGIAGRITGTTTIQGCSNEANIGSNDTTGGSGGIVGILEEADKLDILGCSNFGNQAMITNKNDAGGLIGDSKGTLKISTYNNNGSTMVCSNSGPVSAICAGGFIGYTNKKVIITATSSNKFTNSGQISSPTYAGGMVGQVVADVELTHCTNTGTITASSESGTVFAGGLIGYSNKFTGNNCTNQGTVSTNTQGTTKSSVAGGLFGTATSYSFSTCSNTGSVSAVVKTYPVESGFKDYGKFDLYYKDGDGSVASPKYAGFAGGFGGYATTYSAIDSTNSSTNTNISSYAYKRLVRKSSWGGFYPYLHWLDFRGGFVGYVFIDGEISKPATGNIDNWTDLKGGTYYDNSAKARAESIETNYWTSLPQFGGGFYEYHWKSDSKGLGGDSVEVAEMKFSIARAILTTYYWRYDRMWDTTNERKNKLIDGWTIR